MLQMIRTGCLALAMLALHPSANAQGHELVPWPARKAIPAPTAAATRLTATTVPVDIDACCGRGGVGVVGGVGGGGDGGVGVGRVGVGVAGTTGVPGRARSRAACVCGPSVP